MKEYSFKEIESRIQKYWDEHQLYSVKENPDKPKYYVLDMFPYPSGAGLHVGHPLGYIASDVYARYKRLQGFNVLHPMGYDSFGLPAEQYAIQTGQHPAKTTAENIKRYRNQLDKIGFSFDWNREIQTCKPEYYQWTQWIFLELFHSWYNPEKQRAESIETLIHRFEKKGFQGNADADLTGGIEYDIKAFSGKEWKKFSAREKELILLNFRLAYLSEAYVNWCPVLGTVLSNDEVKDGVSERGGHPVERKLMKQWSLRITAYAERLLKGLDDLHWTQSLKDAQRNWIGKSHGALVKFKMAESDIEVEVFTTRPDTIFGVSFITLAPENELVEAITAPDMVDDVEAYLEYAANRNERERQAEVNKISGQFTGAYAIHPFTGQEIPVWIGDYVLNGYGTGAVMGVPAHDARDFRFAKHFDLPIKQVNSPDGKATDHLTEALDSHEGICFQSYFLNGLTIPQAIARAIEEIEKKNVGKGKINYRLRDAIFGRQRYWGEPIPMYYRDEIPLPIQSKHLPLILPEISTYLPTESGEPPLARADKWWYHPEKGLCSKAEDPLNEGGPIEMTTMPGWAGSSWYFLRYMDPSNTETFVSEEAVNYWKQIDLYMGGSEHATGHLLYFRFWTKFLFDIGYIPFDEPAKRLINQGMIQGRSNFVYRIKDSNTFVSMGLKDGYETTAIHVDVNLVQNDILDIEALRKWRDDFKDAEFILEDGKYICGWEIAKMSKRWYNVVNPDDICERYGADTLRLFEMFLGPLEQSKPWNTQGIEGVHRFLKKLWRMFFDAEGKLILSNEKASATELKSLHKTIKKVQEDIENFSFNTSVSAYMICLNELSDQKCTKREILEAFLIILSPYAPHICEELWQLSGNKGSILNVKYPTFQASYLIENSFSYPVSVNGKHRTNIEFALDKNQSEIESEVLANEIIQKWLEGKQAKKIVFVKGKIINLVV